MEVLDIFLCLLDRSGVIKAGDVIIAINGQSCDYVTLDEAVSMLKKTGEIVYLKIKKDGSLGTSPSMALQ